MTGYNVVFLGVEWPARRNDARHDATRQGDHWQARTKKMDAAEQERVARRLEKITAANGGRLTPTATVRDAQSPTSPLHTYFEWDNSIAGHQHRLEQARRLIRSIRITIIVHDKEMVSVAYVRHPNVGTKQGYIPVAKAADERSMAIGVINEELGRAAAAIRRVRQLAHVFDLTEEVDDVLAKLTAITERVRKRKVA